MDVFLVLSPAVSPPPPTSYAASVPVWLGTLPGHYWGQEPAGQCPAREDRTGADPQREEEAEATAKEAGEGGRG